MKSDYKGNFESWPVAFIRMLAKLELKKPEKPCKPRRYKVNLEIISRKKAEPRIVLPYEPCKPKKEEGNGNDKN